MHGRIHVREREFVGGNLAVRVHVPLAQQHLELAFREGRVDAGQFDRVERKVPGREPRIFPRIGHRKHVAVEDMRPLPIPAMQPATRWWRWLGRVALQPAIDLVIVELLGPKESGLRLAHDAILLALGRLMDARGKKSIGLVLALLENGGERITEGLPAGRHLALLAQAHAHGPALAGGDFLHVVRRRFGSDLGRIDRVGLAMDHRLVKSVLHERLLVRDVEKAQLIGLVLGEKLALQFALAGGIKQEKERAQRGVIRYDGAVVAPAQLGPYRRFLGHPAP